MNKRLTRPLVHLSAVLMMLAGVTSAADKTAPVARSPDLMQAYAVLAQGRFVDLTHAFDTAAPHWKGYPKMSVRTLYTISKDGFKTDEYCHVGQWGTHIDAPAHFFAGLNTLDRIEPRQMLLPLVIIDVHDKVARNPDYLLSLQDVQDWERRHGRIPAHAFVAMRTDWSHRWPDEAALQNLDANGTPHFPGWSLSVMKLLYEQRGISASGHETSDADAGIVSASGHASIERYLLGSNHYQIELLTNLDQLPEYGALVMVSFPKALNGTGFPARVIAIAPQ